MLGEGFFCKVTQDSVVEVGERVQFFGGEQLNEMLADVVHMLGCRVVDGATSGGQKADYDTAGIGRVGFWTMKPKFSMRRS